VPEQVLPQALPLVPQALLVSVSEPIPEPPPLSVSACSREQQGRPYILSR
jgi:hypothetical protein